MKNTTAPNRVLFYWREYDRNKHNRINSYSRRICHTFDGITSDRTYFRQAVQRAYKGKSEAHTPTTGTKRTKQIHKQIGFFTGSLFKWG